ncbi:MAG: hypothetical protein LRZ94_00885 [Candidatus Pacebacteria bacterium]|nr:hypothetical protein [Candidatus Paceibacterota bacterium]
MLYNTHNFKIKSFAGQDTARPELNSVFITANETIATDGFILIKVDSVKEFDIKDYPLIPDKPKALANFQPFMFSKEKIEQVLKIFPPKVSLPILENVAIFKRTKNIAEIGSTDLGGYQGVMNRIVGGRFPDYKQVINGIKNERCIDVEMNPQFLKKIADFFCGFSDKKSIKLSVPVKPNKPLMFSGERNKQRAEAYLMPIKTTE